MHGFFLLGILGFALIRLAHYVILVAQDKKPDDDVGMKKRGGTLILPSGLRLWLVWGARPLVGALMKTGISANQTTLVSLAWAVASGYFIAIGDLLSGGEAIVFSAIFDFLDGEVARRRGTEGPAGAFLDSMVDRFGEAATFLGIAYLYRHERLGAFAALFMLGSANLVSYARARAEGLGFALRGGLMQRGERAVLLAVCAFSDALFGDMVRVPALGDGTAAKLPIFTLGLSLLALASFVTAIQRVILGQRGLGQPKL